MKFIFVYSIVQVEAGVDYNNLNVAVCNSIIARREEGLVSTHALEKT
jgi:hypothetical protein